jgi:hypothetical protein
MNLANVVDLITSKLNSFETPASSLPPIMLKSVSMNRPGLSPYKITAKIIENNKLIGIPTEPYPDGSENKINQYTYNVVKCVCDAIKQDAVVQVAIPCQSILVEAKGGNAGGPIEVIGNNKLDSKATGIIQ